MRSAFFFYGISLVLAFVPDQAALDTNTSNSTMHYVSRKEGTTTTISTDQPESRQ